MGPFLGQVYDWGRFRNTGSNARTTITLKLHTPPPPVPIPEPPSYYLIIRILSSSTSHRSPIFYFTFIFLKTENKYTRNSFYPVLHHHHYQMVFFLLHITVVVPVFRIRSGILSHSGKSRHRPLPPPPAPLPPSPCVQARNGNASKKNPTLYS